MWKSVFGLMRTATAQIRLRIRAVWSGPLLSANRIIGYYRMCQRRVNARMRLCPRSAWLEWHFAHARGHVFAWRGPYSICVNKIKAITHLITSKTLSRLHIHACWSRSYEVTPITSYRGQNIVESKLCSIQYFGMRKTTALFSLSLC